MNLFKRSRTFLALVVAAGFCSLLENHQTEINSLGTCLFYFQKIYGDRPYDVALLGDSRTNSLHLRPLKMHIKNTVFFNLAMSDCRLNPLLLEVVSKEMAKDGKRILVFGLTPLFLTPECNVNSGNVVSIFGRSLFFRTIRSRSQIEGKFTYAGFIDGFDSTKETDKVAQHRTFRQYFNQFKNFHFNFFYFKHFVQNLKWCKRNNIKVVAYRMVSCREMDELEDKLSGVDWNKIKQAVLDEGFVWLERPPSPLLEQIEEHCWDASHLDAEGAELFSNWLGQELAKLDWFKEEQQTSETEK